MKEPVTADELFELFRGKNGVLEEDAYLDGDMHDFGEGKSATIDGRVSFENLAAWVNRRVVECA